MYFLRRLLQVVSVVTLIYAVTGTSVYSQETEVKGINLTGVDISAFPQITVHARIVGEDGTLVPVLAEQDLSVKEDDQAVDVSVQRVTVGVRTAIVFDVGAGASAPGVMGRTRLDDMKLAARQFIGGMGASDETLIIMELSSGSVEIHPLSSDKSALAQAVDSITVSLSSEYSNGLQGVDRALTDLGAAPASSKHASVVVFTPGFELGATEANLVGVIEQASRLDAQINTVLVRKDLDPNVERYLQRLADDSGGYFVRAASEAALATQFDRIYSFRDQFALTYRSTSVTGDNRTVEVTARVEDDNVIAPWDTTSYSIELQVPTIQITSPEPGEVIVRDAKASAGDLDAAEPTQMIVRATVEWSDGFERQLAEAQLFVNGEPHGSALEEPSGELTFVWDLRTFRSTGENRASLQVRVKDELGLRAESEELVAAVIVNAPANTGTLSLGLVLGGIALLVAVVAVGGVLLVYRGYRRGDRPVEVVQSVGASVKKTYFEVLEQFGGKPERVRAYLKVLGGADDIGQGKVIDIRKKVTHIGRDRGRAEVLFQQNEAQPIVSGLHCRIEEVADGEFVIIDEQSLNHTFLRDVRIDPGEKEPLFDGDIIELGKYERGGVRLEFLLPESAETSGRGSPPTKHMRAQ